jgi:hypothetical protein
MPMPASVSWMPMPSYVNEYNKNTCWKAGSSPSLIPMAKLTPDLILKGLSHQCDFDHKWYSGKE